MFEPKHYQSIDELLSELKRNDPINTSSAFLEFEMVQGSKGGCKILPSIDGLAFLYRGQNHRWQPCVASVWRKGQPSDDPQLNWILSRVRAAEFEKLLKQHPMMEIAKENKIEIDYDALAQHYGIPTFWMDITSSIDIASFFAVAKFDRDGRISPCEQGTGIIYRVHWRSVENRWRFFTSITHSPASRPGKQHGWSIGMNRETDFDAQEFVERFEFVHDKSASERIIDSYAARLFPSDSITDIALTLKKAPAVTMSGIRFALERDGCPSGKIEAISLQWGERLCNGLNLDVYLDEGFALTDEQIQAGAKDAAVARKNFLSEVGFRSVRSLKADSVE